MSLRFFSQLLEQQRAGIKSVKRLEVREVSKSLIHLQEHVRIKEMYVRYECNA